MRFATMVLSTLFLLGAAGPAAKKGDSKKVESNGPPAEVAWLNYEEGLKKAKRESKYLFVDFYTNWCGYCKKLDREVFSDSVVKVVLTRHFVTVKTNAESNRRFTLVEGTDTSEYTDASLAGKEFGVRGYPALWFLTPTAEKITYIPGYVPKQEFVNVLNHIYGETYRAQSYDEYVQVIITDSGFFPSTKTVLVGTTVKWVNKDMTAAVHTVYSEGGTELNSENIPNKGTYSYTFTKPGKFSYRCSAHPSRKGIVIVRDSPQKASSEHSGKDGS